MYVHMHVYHYPMFKRRTKTSFRTIALCGENIKPMRGYSAVYKITILHCLVIMASKWKFGQPFEILIGHSECVQAPNSTKV